jgi:hypothetical protein
VSTPEDVVFDLIARVESSLRKAAHVAADTGIAFSPLDIVDDVDRGLPQDYYLPATGSQGRRELIARTVRDVIDSKLQDVAAN